MCIRDRVSGGVDSSVVVYRLKEMGYDPTIFYIKIGIEDKEGYIDCPSEDVYKRQGSFHLIINIKPFASADT